MVHDGNVTCGEEVVNAEGGGADPGTTPPPCGEPYPYGIRFWLTSAPNGVSDQRIEGAGGQSSCSIERRLLALRSEFIPSTSSIAGKSSSSSNSSSFSFSFSR